MEKIIDKKIVEELSKHYYMNIAYSIYYADVANQVALMGMKNFSSYIKQLSEDKWCIHKNLIYDYLNKQDEKIVAKLELIQSKQFNNPKEVIKDLMENEIVIRSKVKELAQLAKELNDYETYEFWTWFVNDGIKDWDEVKSIQDLFDLSDDLLLIDSRIEEVTEEEKK